MTKMPDKIRPSEALTLLTAFAAVGNNGRYDEHAIKLYSGILRQALTPQPVTDEARQRALDKIDVWEKNCQETAPMFLADGDIKSYEIVMENIQIYKFIRGALLQPSVQVKD